VAHSESALQRGDGRASLQEENDWLRSALRLAEAHIKKEKEVRVCVCVCLCVYVHISIHIYIHICIQGLEDVNIHVYIQGLGCRICVNI
jgi:hypothetical protein